MCKSSSKASSQKLKQLHQGVTDNLLGNFMVEYYEFSLIPDVISGTTCLIIIKVSVLMHLLEFVCLPPKLGQFNLHFKLY